MVKVVLPDDMNYIHAFPYEPDQQLMNEKCDDCRQDLF